MGIRAGQFSRVPRFQRNRRANPKLSANTVGTFDFTTPNVTITLDMPVTLNGIPQILTNTGKLPVSATRPTPTSVVLVYDTPGSVTTVTVPNNDPAIRTVTGGWLSAGTFPAA